MFIELQASITYHEKFNTTVNYVDVSVNIFGSIASAGPDPLIINEIMISALHKKFIA